MMGYQKHLESYLTLTRKELQGLCKKHSLPANRSHSQLAKSLASYLKKKNTDSAPPKKRSVSLVKVSFDSSFVPESKTEEASNPMNVSSKGAYEKTNSSNNGSYALTSGLDNKLGDDRPHPQSGNPIETSSHMTSQTSNKAFSTAANAVCLYPVNNETTEGIGSPISKPGDKGKKSLLAADLQEIITATRLSFECCEAGSKNCPQRSSQLKTSGQTLLNHVEIHSETHNLTQVPYIHKRAGECSTENRLMSSDEIAMKASPSLQFYVMSEEGINLFVDLNSSPLEWINSLKDEVCIHPKAQYHELRSLSNHNKGLADEHMETLASESTQMDLQSNVSEKNAGVTNSSLSSVVSENCHPEVFVLDATAATSRSSVLTSSSVPFKISKCLDCNQMVSPSGLTYSDVDNHMTSDVASCPREGKVLPQDSDHTLLGIIKSNGSIPDVSVGNEDVMGLDRTIHSNRVVCCTSRIASADSKNLEASALGKILNSTSDKHNLMMSNGIQDILETSNVSNPKPHSGEREVSMEGWHMERSREESGCDNRLTNSYQFVGQMVLDCPMADAQSDVGSADHLFNQHACHDLRNSVPEDRASTSDDESGRTTPAKGTNSSECLRFKQLTDKGYIGSHNRVFPKELRSKKQHAECEKKSGTMTLRSSKFLTKDTICDLVNLPRRSTRLVSK